MQVIDAVIDRNRVHSECLNVVDPERLERHASNNGLGRPNQEGKI